MRPKFDKRTFMRIRGCKDPAQMFDFDVVIDPVAGSGSTLRAAAELNRNAYGFEIKKDFYKLAQEKMLVNIPISMF